MFQNVSDEAISAGDSASFIISQMIAFGIEAKDAQSIIDKVNETANKFSVSSGDLSKALGIVASTSSAMGNSIDQTLGVVTAITEQTRNASKSARAANTIFSRLAQVVDENSDTGAKLTEIYDNLGIALYDSSGQMRSTYDILADLASKWDSLDKNTQQYIAITSAGTNQLNNFLALMNNFDHAAEATATSINSAGSAMRENEAYQESLEYQTNNLKATFQDLANNVIDKELISSVLKLSNAFLELADTGLGQFIAKTALLGGTAWGLSSLVKVTKIIPVITSQFKNLASVIGMISNPAVISSIGGIGTALSTVGGFAGVALPMLLGISAALVGIVELVDYIENKDVRKLESLSSAIQDTNDKIAEMSGVGSEYDTLINNADKLTEKEQERLGVLQAQLDNLKEQAAEQEAAYLKEWQSQQTEQKTETTHKLVTGSADEVPEGATKLYGQYWDVATTTEYTESQRAAENLRTAINNLNSEKRQGVTVGNEYISKLQGIIDEYQETYDTTIKVRDAGYELDDSQEYLVKVMEHQKEVISGLGAEYAQNSEDIGQFANSLDESASKLDAYIAALDEYRGANEDASSASATLVNSLFDANGQLTEAAQQALTADGAMASMAQSFIQSQMQAAQADYSTLILAIQEVGNAAMITSAQLANMMAMAGVGGSTSDMKRTYQIKYGKSAEADTEAYNKWLSSTLADAADAKYRYRMQELQNQLKQVSGYVPSGGGGGGSRKSAEEKAAEEAEKQAKKAQKAQEKAAKQSQQAYESAAKSAEQAAQEAARAAEQAAEEAKRKILDSIQELKDASDDFWDSKTDAIEETNKELDRQKQLEEKLKALEEAKQKKILLYKNGQFQYDKDYGTIAKAQADYEETRDKIQRERELEQLKEMKDNATEIFNEMKDIVQNGGNVTQEMINSWLSQMQADGADYYDSNKQMLSEWLDWAKGAISEISNQVASSSGGSGGHHFGGSSLPIKIDKIDPREVWQTLSVTKEVNGQIVKYVLPFYRDLQTRELTNILPFLSKSQSGEYPLPEVGASQNWWSEILNSPFADGINEDDSPELAYGKYLQNFLEYINNSLDSSNVDPRIAGTLKEYKKKILDMFDKMGYNESPYVYAWSNWFNRELQGKLDLGSNSVFAGYQDKLLSGTIDDPYEEQEYYQRNQAIKALYNEYKKITDQLGYIPDYLKDFMDMGSQMLNNVDLVARQMADNYDNLSASGKSLLDSLVSGEEDYEAANKMRIAYLAENYSPERLRYMNLVRVAGSSRNAMQLMNQRTEEDKARDEEMYGDWLNELRDKIDKAGGVVTDEIYNWYLKTAGGALGAKGTGDAQLYTDVFAGGGKYLYSDQEELERLGYHGFLGNFGNVSEGGLSDATKNLVKSKILTSTTETNIDKQKEQITQNNIKGIKDTLEKYQEGYGATQHWIDDASKYITDTLNKNNEALLTADAETRKSLLAQNDELIGIRDSLSGVKADKDVSKLPGSTTSYNDWEFKIENPTDEELAAKAEQRAQKLAEQMAANSKAWWDASSKAEQDALHKANEELAKQINELTGSNLTYEGHTGTWSKNASGTHNFRGGLSLVGERGPELRVLGQGDNIIPAYQTANLWKWSGTTPESMLKTLELRKGNGCSSYTFNVSKLELPNVNNAKEFVAGLKNYALQYSYRR